MDRERYSLEDILDFSTKKDWERAYDLLKASEHQQVSRLRAVTDTSKKIGRGIAVYTTFTYLQPGSNARWAAKSLMESTGVTLYDTSKLGEERLWPEVKKWADKSGKIPRALEDDIEAAWQKAEAKREDERAAKEAAAKEAEEKRAAAKTREENFKRAYLNDELGKLVFDLDSHSRRTGSLGMMVSTRQEVTGSKVSLRADENGYHQRARLGNGEQVRKAVEKFFSTTSKELIAVRTIHVSREDMWAYTDRYDMHDYGTPEDKYYFYDGNGEVENGFDEFMTSDCNGTFEIFIKDPKKRR